MRRILRLETPGLLHYVMVRGIERRKAFNDDKDRLKIYNHRRLRFENIEKGFAQAGIIAANTHHAIELVAYRCMQLDSAIAFELSNGL